MTDQLSKPECLTCNNITIPYEDPSQHTVRLDSSENCLYYTASFSNNGDYYVLECMGDRIPISYIKKSDNSSFECTDIFIFYCFYWLFGSKYRKIDLAYFN